MSDGGRRSRLWLGAIVAAVVLGACASEDPVYEGPSTGDRPDDVPILPVNELELVVREGRVLEISFGCPAWGEAELVVENDAEIRVSAEATFGRDLGDCIASDCFTLEEPLGDRPVINEATGEEVPRADRFTDCPLPPDEE